MTHLNLFQIALALLALAALVTLIVQSIRHRKNIKSQL